MEKEWKQRSRTKFQFQFDEKERKKHQSYELNKLFILSAFFLPPFFFDHGTYAALFLETVFGPIKISCTVTGTGETKIARVKY